MKGAKKRAAASLVTCLWLYSGHRVDGRGASGLILDAIRELDPQAARTIEAGGDNALRDALRRLQAPERERRKGRKGK